MPHEGNSPFRGGTRHDEDAWSLLKNAAWLTTPTTGSRPIIQGRTERSVMAVLDDLEKSAPLRG
jgi:hypothetical protein